MGNRENWVLQVCLPKAWGGVGWGIWRMGASRARTSIGRTSLVSGVVLTAGIQGCEKCPDSQRAPPGKQKEALGIVVLRVETQGQVCSGPQARSEGCLSNHGQIQEGCLVTIWSQRKNPGEQPGGCHTEPHPRWIE